MSLFFVGDEVRHRSNAVVMKVLGISHGQAVCEWHDGQTLHRRAYWLDELQPVVSMRGTIDSFEIRTEYRFDLGAPPIVPRGTFTDGDET